MQPPRMRDVGRDVSTESLAVADVANAYEAEVVARGRLGTHPCDLDRRLRKRHSKRTPLVFV